MKIEITRAYYKTKTIDIKNTILYIVYFDK